MTLREALESPLFRKLKDGGCCAKSIPAAARFSARKKKCAACLIAENQKRNIKSLPIKEGHAFKCALLYMHGFSYSTSNSLYICLSASLTMLFSMTQEIFTSDVEIIWILTPFHTTL
jgi:hypothetical protein